MVKDAVNWLLEFFHGPTYSLSLIQLVVAFCATFLAAEAVLAVCQRVAIRRPLRWSGHILSLLIAAAFWAPLFVFVIGQLEDLAGYLDGKSYHAFSVLAFFGALISIGFGGILLGSPFSFLIIPILLLYLLYPNRFHSRKAVVAVVCAVITVMVANYAWQIVIADGPSS
jgi:hypothetical protein